MGYEVHWHVWWGYLLWAGGDFVFGSNMIRWFWSCLVKTCCLWSKDLPSCLCRQVSCASVGSFAILCKWTVASTAQLGSVWKIFNDFSDFSDSSKSQGWLGHWPWQHDSMTQLSPWGLGLCQWSEVHLPRRAKVEQVEQYPKPSSFRRLKKGLSNFAHSYSLVLLYWNFQVQYWCNHRCTNVTGLWTRADKSGRFLHLICQVWARRFDQKCLRIGYLWMHWFIIMFHILKCQKT